MKQWVIGAVVAGLVASLGTFVPTDADARRLGGGKSTGMQRNMPERTAPDAARQAPTAPAGATQNAAPAQQAQPGAAAATGAAAQAGKRSWAGPLAGLAAGLGLAALASWLGFGEAFANILLIALLVLAGFALFAFIRRRMAGPGAAPLARTPALAGAGAGAGPVGAVGAERTSTAPVGAGAGAAGPFGELGRSGPAPAGGAGATPAVAPAAPGRAPVAAAFVPAAFDSESFERIAKTIFIRLQAANDAGNLEDLRQFTTPEMFASLKLDILDRQHAPQATEVRRVEAKVLDVAEEEWRQIVSVRYTGELVETPGAEPTAFDEVWHLIKPRDVDTGWVIAGIEQMA